VFDVRQLHNIHRWLPLEGFEEDDMEDIVDLGLRRYAKGPTLSSTLYGP
jgi:hypothetical protein